MNLKRLNYRKEIISKLYFSKELSSTDLSKQIGKSIPLTTKVVGQLIDENIVAGVGQAFSTGGRRPVIYALKEDVFFIVCVALDQFVARITIVNMHNRFVTPVEKFELPLPGNVNALEKLTQYIQQFLDGSGIPREKIIGIGIGMPGFVAPQKGINYTFLKTKGKSITQVISEATGLPVYIDNDSSIIALAELRFGAARGKSNAMVVNIGWGIGLGMILNNELYRGQEGFAGEFSHISLFSNGKMCSCGKSGCLETETSLLVLIEKAKKALKEGTTSMMQAAKLEHYEEASETIVAAVMEGDRYAIELFSEAGYNIGRGLAILIHLLNPELIILSGRGASVGKIWLAPVQQALNEHCIPRLVMHTQLDLSTLGYNAELIGAAALVMESYGSKGQKKSVHAVAVSTA